MRQLIRPREAWAAMGVSPATGWRMSKSPGFPSAYRVGRQALAFDRAELELWLESRRVRRTEQTVSEARHDV
jgi:predicted DNA-binding transcriptional regulator AlpA